MRNWKIILGLVVLICNQARAEVLLGEKDFSAAIIEELQEQDETVEVEFFGGKTTVGIADAKQAKIMISHFKVNEEQQQFTAKAEIFADGVSFAKTDLVGKYYPQIKIYVPAREIAKGKIIKADDLHEIKVRARKVKDDNVVSLEKLVGKEAKKVLKVNRLIRQREIGDKILIEKGTTVNSVYLNKDLQITAKAVALEDGAKGQMIVLQNTQSSKKFTARVVDAETVEIVVE